jgi:hypothetical protein
MLMRPAKRLKYNGSLHKGLFKCADIVHLRAARPVLGDGRGGGRGFRCRGKWDRGSPERRGRLFFFAEAAGPLGY